jgi:predicted HTH domain antitoxin
MIKLYREGKLSLSSLAAKLEVSLSEAIDLLAEFGVESPLDFSDYLDGLRTIET